MSKEKIVILGDKGMLGHVVKRYLKEQEYFVTGLNRENVDFRDSGKLYRRISKLEPKYVINCAGILNHSKNLDDLATINIMLPRQLAVMAKTLEFKLIHISTNCVYNNRGPHSTFDVPDARNLYGMSKAFGDIRDGKNLTIRTSIIGPELKENGSGLMNFLFKAPDKLSGFINADWNGVTTLELAKFIEENMKEEHGLMNFHTKDTINKYDLLCLINNIWGLNKEITPIEREGVHVSLLKGYKSFKSYNEQLQELYDWYYKYDREEVEQERDEALE